MTVHLNMEEGLDRPPPLPPFTVVREPTTSDASMLVFGTYKKRGDWDSRKTSVAAKVWFDQGQTLEERKAEVAYAIDLCELVHRARSEP